MTELTLFADHHQIHVFDESSRADLGAAWTGEAAADGLAAAGDAVAIGTAVNVGVAVRVELPDRPPADDSAEFDHVVEVSIHCASGRLVVMGCTDYEPDARRFPVAAGWLRLRASRSNLHRAGRAGIDSDDDPQTTERLRLQVWPGPYAAATVVKRWPGPA